LERNRIDLVIALNMTLPHAAPVTAALHKAVHDRFADGRPGGILLWDRDLFGSCAIRDRRFGERVYPAEPNRVTPLPQRNAFTRWGVASDALAAEARRYPTDAQPVVLPHLLPDVSTDRLGQRHEEFMRERHIPGDRPIILAPVRVTHRKGVEIALSVLAGARAAARERGLPSPTLLVFGSLDEDPGYAQEVLERTRGLGLDENVRYLDGVPLSSHRGGGGVWRLDEADLLQLARETGGGVIFTPSVPDVETVGLGPALAAIAGVPCALTQYDAFDGVYQRERGARYSYIRVGDSPEEAGRAFVDVLRRTGEREWTDRLAVNRRIVERAFPIDPWRDVWHQLAEQR
jgi:hypothetical protein